MARSLAAKIEAANTALMANGNLDAISSLSGDAQVAVAYAKIVTRAVPWVVRPSPERGIEEIVSLDRPANHGLPSKRCVLSHFGVAHGGLSLLSRPGRIRRVRYGAMAL